MENFFDVFDEIDIEEKILTVSDDDEDIEFEICDHK